MPTKIVLNLLAVTGIALAGGQAHAILNVSAVVRPAARIDIVSATTVKIFATMFPNAEGLVWATMGSCSTPQNPKSFAASGPHDVNFTPEEVAGKNIVCLATTDGVLHVSARLPQ